MSDIYEMHDKAFKNVSAYVILKDGERVATVAFKFPADGAGRLYAYVHWIGTEMVRGFAGGGGYDKRSAAVADALHKPAIRRRVAEIREETTKDDGADNRLFLSVLTKDDGNSWNRRLRDAGFTVLQAV